MIIFREIRKVTNSEDWWWWWCSVAQSRMPLSDPMNCSTPGFPVLHNCPEFAQTHVHQVTDALQTSSVARFSCLQSFPVLGSFLLSRLFASGGQSIGASPSASVLPRNIQGWFPLGWTSLIFLLSKGLSRVLLQHLNFSFFTLNYIVLFQKFSCDTDIISAE